MAAVEVLRAAGAMTPQGVVEVLRAGGIVAPSPVVEVLRAAGSVVVSLAANAGADQTVTAGQRVYLNGSASSGRPELFYWQQTGGDGPVVTLSNPNADGPSFIAPYTPTGCELRFTLFVALEGGEFTASPDEVVITVRWHPVFIKRAGALLPVTLDQVLRMVGVPQ